MRLPTWFAFLPRLSLAFLAAPLNLLGPAGAGEPDGPQPPRPRPVAASQAAGVRNPDVPPGGGDGPAAKEKAPDVIFVPTPQAVVDKMLELAGVKTGDVLYDLGCGDGRIVVTAAKRFGVKATGIDIDPQRVKESRENVRKNGVGELVTIKQGDIFEADLGGASVVTLYLLPALNVRLMPKLKTLPPGTRIVSHDFDMKGARPRQVVTVRAEDDDENGEHTVYLWVVPWEDEKSAPRGGTTGSSAAPTRAPGSPPSDPTG